MTLSPFILQLRRELRRRDLPVRSAKRGDETIRLAVALKSTPPDRLTNANGDLPQVWSQIFVTVHRTCRHLGNQPPLFRCVPETHLARVRATGIDVQPTSAHFYATQHVDKALEYGGAPKLLLLLDRSRLDRTYREVPADTDPRALAELTAVFPTVLPSADGRQLWLSRLPETDRGVAGSYEAEYGYWIPGDAGQALPAASSRSYYVSVLIIMSTSVYYGHITMQLDTFSVR